MKNKYVILILVMFLLGVIIFSWFMLFGFGFIQSLILGGLLVLIGMFK